MARSERSAGVIVFREDSDVPGGRSFLLLDYGRYWDYPKGHVERGEDDRDAALRELAEETGIRDAELIEGFRKLITYFFRARQGLVRKQVVFFLARTQRKRATISDEHVGYVFLPYEQALERLTYANSTEVLREAEAFLRGGKVADTSDRRERTGPSHPKRRR